MRHSSLISASVLLTSALAVSGLRGQDLPTVPEGYSVSIFAQDFERPLGLAVSPAGDVVVCSWEEGKVYSLDSQGAKTLLNPGQAVPNAAQSAATGEGRQFFTAGGTGTGGKIWEIVDGQPVLFYQGQGAFGLEWDGTGHLYFTQAPTGSVVRSDLEGNRTVFANGLGGGIADLTFGPDGNLYVANDDNGTIYRIDSDGVVEPYLTDLPRPEMLAFDGEGNLYFTAFTSNTVYKVDTEKHITSFLRGVPDTDIRGIAFDAAGSFFACDDLRGLVYKVRRETSTPGEPRSTVRQVGPRCLAVELEHRAAIRGGEIALAYDPEKLVPVGVSPGRDLPPGAELLANLDPVIGCEPGAGVAAGLSIYWLSPALGSLPLPAGTHQLLKVCFAPAEGVEIGACGDVSFVSCLGPSEAPIRNIVTDEDGRSVAIGTEGGSLCLGEELPFRRGDVNADGSFDVSDPINILGCLFLGTQCSDCGDASDANDDGQLNIADPTFLLSWRFLGSRAPPAPFPDCARDPTPDAVAECESFEDCTGE